MIENMEYIIRKIHENGKQDFGREDITEMNEAYNYSLHFPAVHTIHTLSLSLNPPIVFLFYTFLLFSPSIVLKTNGNLKMWQLNKSVKFKMLYVSQPVHQ